MMNIVARVTMNDDNPVRTTISPLKTPRPVVRTIESRIDQIGRPQIVEPMPMITMAVIGGCLLTGGYGSVAGTALGALALRMANIGIVYASISRNFFLGNEPTLGFGPFRRFDATKAARVAKEEMHNIGIDVRDTEQLVGTLSGGERQTLAIARAEYFGAKVLILDEPTSALGVKDLAIVLRHAIAARNKGLGVIFITHNVQHALPIGDSFTILTRGRSGGTYRRGQLNAEQLHAMMGGGSELEELQADLEMLARREERGEDVPAVPIGTDPDSGQILGENKQF